MSINSKKSEIVPSIDFSKFPTTRYQGSKRKITPWIYEVVKDIPFKTVLDGFGGSSVVSYLFKRMNKQVTYTDTLQFNCFIAKAIIENDTIKLLAEDITRILQRTEKVEYPETVQKIFKDIYYLDQENEWIDTVTPNILHMNHYDGEILEYKKALAFYALVQSCIIKRPFNLFHRKNLNLRITDVKRSFGNKTTWDTDFTTHFKRFVDEANNSIFQSMHKCIVKNISVFDIEGDFDLVYLDAPYFKKNDSNETSNYYKIYHFLEGLALYDEWIYHIDYSSNNLRLCKINTEEELSRNNICEKFEILFDKFRNSKIVVSYKYGGVPSVEWIIKTMKLFKKNVHAVSKHYAYALNHQNGDAKLNREYLIIGS
jgi:adenine-specific DNA methylase